MGRNKIKELFIKKCLWCKDSFEVYNANRIFCSKSCAISFRNNNMSRELLDERNKNISNSRKNFYKTEKGKKNKEYLKNLYKDKSWEQVYGHDKAKIMKKRSSESGKIAQNRPEVKLRNSIKQKIVQNRPEVKLKRSLKFSGKNNPMYGKPSPIGSGNGWSGWYNNWYFRSLLELSYMINVIERFNFKWESAEKRKYRINYIDCNNKNKTHFADFIINNKYLIEIKPKNLFNTANNKLINEATIKYCDNNNLKFKIIEPIKLSDKTLKEMVLNKKITLIDRYMVKFEKKYNDK